MIKVGVTGNMGSGKTTVCKIFEVLGVPVYYADDRAKDILQTDAEVIRKVKELFGDDVYDANNGDCNVAIDDMVYVFSDGELLDVAIVEM